MKKTLTLLTLTLSLAASSQLRADACKVNNILLLVNQLKAPITDCEDSNFPKMRSIEITKDITSTIPIDIPDNTRIVGVQTPDSPQIKVSGNLKEGAYLIKLGNQSLLSNLDISNMPEEESKPLLALIYVAGSFNTIKLNKISGNASVGIMIGTPFSNPPVIGNYNVIGVNSVLANQGVGMILTGFNNVVISNSINASSDEKFSGKGGLLLFDWPQLIVSNNIFPSGKEVKAITFANNWLGQSLPIGMAANLINNNSILNTDKKKYAPLTSTDTNFDEYFKKPLNSLPTCAGKEAAPYYDDGTCKQALAAKTCPPSLILLQSGDCGCSEGTTLDTQLNVCVKTVEKTVEKIVEKIIEKPVPSVSSQTAVGPMQPIVAQPASGGSGCSLVSEATAASPVLAFLAIITLTGLIAYRTRPQAARVRTKKERRHD